MKKNYTSKEIKNIVLLGHSGSGKTTLAEAMAYEGKVIERRGTVEADTTLSDYTDVEHLNKRSIYSTLLYTEYNDHKLNIIDSPGSDDFCGSLHSSLRVSDIGVMVINAQSGFEVGSEIQGRYAAKNGKPIIYAVNQLDSEKASWDNTIETINAGTDIKAVIAQYPINPGPDFDSFIDLIMMKMYKFKGDTGIREEMDIPADQMDRANELHAILVEAAAENDEELMEIFFEKETLTTEQLLKGLGLGIAKRGMAPIFCLSAKKDIGVKRIMEFIIAEGPCPTEVPQFKTVEGNEVECDASKPASVFVFRTAMEQHLGEVSYFRVVSGKVSEGIELTNQDNQSKEKFSQIFAVAGKNKVKVTELNAGDLGCTVKLKGTRINNTLTAAGADFKIAPTTFPASRYRCAVKPVNAQEEEKMGEFLNKANFDDPTIIVEYSKELKQTILKGQGEQHLNILKWQLENIGKIQVTYSEPRISYRETITKVAAANYRHKKQSGGAGQFGEVHMVIEPYIEGVGTSGKYKIDGKDTQLNIKQTDEIPLDWGGKLVFCWAIVGGAIDARFQPAILKGIMEKMEEGPLTGSPARDIRVVVYDGKMHPVDSNELSFKLAARNAFKEAFRNAGPKIMEPIYSVEVMVPSDSMGDVMSDLQNRRAMIEGMESEKGFQVLRAKVPLATMYRYSTTLSSLTSGRASYTMIFSEFSQVPTDVQDKLLKAYQEEDKDE